MWTAVTEFHCHEKEAMGVATPRLPSASTGITFQ
jgi:hypothetical protein